MFKLSQHIVRIETTAAAVCLTTSTFLIFIAAVARSFEHPINWALDISLFLFAWATFLSADVAFRDDKLVSLDMFVSWAPPGVIRVVKGVIYLVILAFLVALLAYGLRLAYVSRARAFQGIPTVSFSWVTLSMPVGASLLIETTLEKMWALVRGAAPTTDVREALNLQVEDSPTSPAAGNPPRAEEQER